MVRKELVTKVIDGDTFKTKKRKVRLEGVDAPEKGQAGYDDATKVLKMHIEGKLVTIDGKVYDDFGRLLAEVTVRDTLGNKDILNVNQCMRDFLNKFYRK